MPKLTEITKSSRVEAALQVLQMLTVNPKMTQKQACDKVGITPEMYRFWISQNDDAIRVFRDVISQVEREELVTAITARAQIFNKLVKDALASYTDPISRLEIFKFIVQHSEQMLSNQRVVDNESVRGLLSGPDLSPGESRLSSRNTLEITNISPDEISVKVKQPVIIDGKISG